MQEFLKTFYSDSTVPLNKETLRKYTEEYYEYHKNNPDLIKVWTKSEELGLMLPSVEEKIHVSADEIREARVFYEEIKPRFAQIEALEELDKTLEEGYDKALVVMATGLGKTYLAGFFARKFKRILFVAHREEILQQAKNSFLKIMPERVCGIFDGKRKEKNADTIFASIFTLSMKKHLYSFAKDEFDLIIVDEFHHAAAESYKRVLNYFERFNCAMKWLKKFCGLGRTKNRRERFVSVHPLNRPIFSRIILIKMATEQFPCIHSR